MTKKYFSLLLLCFMAAVKVQAQQKIISTATSLIKQGQSKEAGQYLDSILALNPNCVDALMMKGNVILSESQQGAPVVSLESVFDESIYDESIGTLGEANNVLDKETALKMEQLWQKCVQLDPTRIDIYQGLCTLYGMALMKPEVIKELPVLIKAAGKKNDDFIYGLENYAFAFEKHDRFNDCLDVLKTISAAYPQAGGLVCDMAVLCEREGKTREAVTYAHRALAIGHNDFLTNYSATAIIAIAENIPAAGNVFKTLQKDDANPLCLYYQSIFMFYNNDKAWLQAMKDFMHKYKSEEKDDPRLAIAEIMTAKNFKLDTATYHKILDIQPYELELLLIDTKAKNEFTSKYAPLMSLANLYASRKCFAQALQPLDEMKHLKLSAEDDSSYLFVLAYAQYESGKKMQSVENWKMLLGSGTFFRQSAACYFIGSAYVEQGQKQKAKELFTTVAQRGSESKFANYCDWKLKGLE